MIFRIEQFANEAGVSIAARTPVSQGVAENNVQILGPTTFHSQGHYPFVHNGQQGQWQFTATIPGDTIEQAFANFHEAMTLAQKDAERERVAKFAAMEQQAARQLVLPNGQAIPRANGHPRTR